MVGSCHVMGRATTESELKMTLGEKGCERLIQFLQPSGCVLQSQVFSGLELGHVKIKIVSWHEFLKNAVKDQLDNYILWSKDIRGGMLKEAHQNCQPVSIRCIRPNYAVHLW